MRNEIWSIYIEKYFEISTFYSEKHKKLPTSCVSVVLFGFLCRLSVFCHHCYSCFRTEVPNTIPYEVLKFSTVPLVTSHCVTQRVTLS